jgi:hypothetical protein
MVVSSAAAADLVILVFVVAVPEEATILNSLIFFEMYLLMENSFLHHISYMENP